MVAPMLLGAGVELGKDPLIAASRLNGNVDAPREPNDGGSTRPNGAEMRRFCLIPAIFLFGERPAGAVDGARGDDDKFALKGVDIRDEGKADGGGIAFADDVKLKVNALVGVASLLFFEGESNIAGSTFSLSNSSKVEGS